MTQDKSTPIHVQGNTTIHTEPPFPVFRTYESKDIGKLAEALSKAQGAYPKLQKNKTANAGKYSYNYSDIADLIECIKKPFSENGLAYIQSPIWDESFFLQTKIVHSSGQWVSSRIPIPNNLPPQQLGSHLTYMRRYALGSMAGVAGEDDDDGQVAQNGNQPKPETAPKKPKAAPTPKQVTWELAKKEGITADEMKGAVPVMFGIKTFDKLDKDQVKSFQDLIKKGRDEFIKTVLEIEAQKAGE